MTEPWRYEFHELRDDSAREQAAASESENRTIRQASISRIGYVSAAYIIGYTLAFYALAAAVATAIVIILTVRDAAGESILSLKHASLKVQQGNCNTNLQAVSLIAHFCINLVGTLVLASSNYVQQICTSPSLSEIVKQMNRRGDIYFGSNSPSAVMRQRSSLTLLWLSLVLTSIPIHIMLNGIVGYAVTPVAHVDLQMIPQSRVSSLLIPSNWTSVSSTQCYTNLMNSAAFVTNFNSVTIVLRYGIEEYSLDFFNGGVDWLPSQAAVIESCYFAFIDSKCQLTVRWFPLVCTSAVLIIKASIVLLALHHHSHFRKRVFNSLGDMITVGARYPQLRDISRQILGGNSKYRPQRIRWVRALGRWDLGVAIFWWMSALGVTIAGATTWFNLGHTLELNLSELFKQYGLGTISPGTSFHKTTTDSPALVPTLVIIANSPQLWLSLGYLLWNTQITRISMEREWRSYYRKAEIPRVSQNTNEPGVRATRWLQLPYWVTAILMTLSTIMHWLVSQTLFVVEIDAVDNPTFYLNYSPFAIMCIGMVATVLVLGMTIYYFIPIRTNMPLMAGSARVVYESCKRLPSKLPSTGIAWGDISTARDRLAGFGETVGPLIVGDKYG